MKKYIITLFMVLLISCLKSLGGEIIDGHEVVPGQQQITAIQGQVTGLSATVGSLGSSVSNLDMFYVSTNTILITTNTANFVITNLYSQINISSFMLYFFNTNNMPFDRTANLWLYNDNTYVTRDTRWLFSGLKFVGTLHTNSLAIGDSVVLVQDATDFTTNDLIYFTAGTNEYTRISTITNTAIYLYDPLQQSHSVSGGVSRVVEIGNMFYMNKRLDKKLYGQLIFSTNVTANIIQKLEYCK